MCKRLAVGLTAIPVLMISGSACDSKLPAVDEGRRIAGQVTYSGSAASAMARPVLQIAAFAEFPPRGPARASIVVAPPHAGAPVVYELIKVPAATYKVVASIVDLDHPTAMDGPSGGFPNLCAVLSSPSPNVTVANDRAVEDVDIVVYDRGADPCFGQQPMVDAGPADAGAVNDAGSNVPDAPIVTADAAPDAPIATADAATRDAATRDAPLSLPDARVDAGPPDAGTADATQADSGT